MSHVFNLITMLKGSGGLVRLMKNIRKLAGIKLTDKGPQIFGQDVVIVPRPLFGRLIEAYADDPGMEYSIYRIMKGSVYEFCSEMDAKQDMDPADMLDVLLKLAKLNGYGHIEINAYEDEEHTAAFFIRDLPSDQLNGAYRFKGDTYWAGMLAGGMSYVFDMDVDCIETQCVLEGANSCRFVVGPRQWLKTMYPDLYARKFERGAETDTSKISDAVFSWEVYADGD